MTPSDQDTASETLLAVFVPTIVFALALVAFVVILRAGSKLWYTQKQSALKPIIIHPASFVSDWSALKVRGDTSSETVVNHEHLPSRALEAEDFIASLRAYIAEDLQGSGTRAPGTTGIVALSVPVEAPNQHDSWLSFLSSFAVSQEPAYHVYVYLLAASGQNHVAVQVVLRPKDVVIAAETFEALETQEIVSLVGGYCLQQVLSQNESLCQIPRWEHWNVRGGYTLFRDALRCEQQGEIADAIKKYDSASRLSLGNLTIALRKASLLEKEGRTAQAVEVYKNCYKLWPECIESTYRYAASLSSVRDFTDSSGESADNLCAELGRRLRLGAILRRYLATYLPGRRSSGERRYWLSWLRPWWVTATIPAKSKRRDFINALVIARAVMAVARTIQMSNATGPEHDREILILRKRVLSTAQARGSGWLTHYNAACFFSLCAELTGSSNSKKLGGAEWKVGDMQSALRQLAAVIRDPNNRLDPSWLNVDPDLRGLRSWTEDEGWRSFLGLRNE